jgi:hypothetical protein
MKIGSVDCKRNDTCLIQRKIPVLLVAKLMKIGSVDCKRNDTCLIQRKIPVLKKSDFLRKKD